MERIYFIYKLTSPNNKVYIGRTKNLNRRFLEYKNGYCKSQQLLYNSLKKYGWDKFKKEIIFHGKTTDEDISNLEILEIKKYSKDITLNLVSSNSFRKSTLLNKFYYCCDIEGNVIDEFINVNDFLEKIKLDVSIVNIHKAMRDKTYYAYGYLWCYKEDYNKKTLLLEINKPHKLSKKLLQIDITGEIVNYFNNSKEAALNTGFCENNIRSCTCGNQITYKGFFWIKEENYNNFLVNQLQTKQLKRKVNVFDKENNFLYECSSISDASKQSKVHYNAVAWQCKYNKEHNFNFIFKFK